MGEIKGRSECLGNALVIGEFFTIVRSDCMNTVRQGAKQVDDGVFDAIGGPVGHFGNQGQSRFALCQGDKCLAMIFADNSIELPVADARASLNDGGTLVNGDTV